MKEPAKNFSPLLRPPPELIRSDRLKIADLLLITLGTAIAIWIMQPPSVPRVLPFVIVNVLMSPLYGSAVAAVLLAIWRAVTGLDHFAIEPGHWLLLPGHWLLLIVGTIFLGVGLIAQGVESLDYFGYVGPSPVSGFYVLFQAGILLIGAVLLTGAVGVVALSTSKGDTDSWKLVFRLNGWTFIFLLLSPLVIATGGGIGLLIVLAMPLALLVTLLVAIVNDLVQPNYRDFWHWLGVAVFLSLPLHFALLILAANIVVAQFP